MTWSISVYDSRHAAEPNFTDSYDTVDALIVAADQLLEARIGEEVLFRFGTPDDASAADLDRLQQFGLVNGEPLDPE